MFCMQNEEIRQKWTDFINDYQIYLMSNEETKYIDTNKHKPSSTSTDTNIKQLGNWIYTQTKNIKKQKESMKNEEVRKKY